MRKNFAKTINDILQKDSNLVMLLGDIGVFGFKQVFSDYPNNIYNMGTCESAMTGFAAGLSMMGKIPVMHSIAPFVTERNYEFIKLDLAYNKLNCNIVSCGGSYDFSTLGSTHHCPADVNILKQIPNMQVVLAGCSKEFDVLFKQAYNNNSPTYFRLSDDGNTNTLVNVKFGEANVIKRGSDATVVVVGNLLDKVIDACWDQDVSIIYYTTLAPFDIKTLRNICNSDKLLLVEPYYEGGLLHDIVKGMERPIHIDMLGVPHMFVMKLTI